MLVCFLIVAKAALAVIPPGSRGRDKILSRLALGIQGVSSNDAKVIFEPETPLLASAQRLMAYVGRWETPLDFESLAESRAMYGLLWCMPVFTTFFWSTYYLSRDNTPSPTDWRAMQTASLLIVAPEADCYDFSFAVNAAVDRVTEQSSHNLEIGALPDVMRIKYRHREGVYPKNFELFFQTVEVDPSAGDGEYVMLQTSQILSPAYFECFAAVKLRSSPGGFDSVKLLPVFGVRPSAPSPNAPWALQSPTFTEGSWYMLYFVLVQMDHHEVPAGTPRLMNRPPEPIGTQTSQPPVAQGPAGAVAGARNKSSAASANKDKLEPEADGTVSAAQHNATGSVAERSSTLSPYRTGSPAPEHHDNDEAAAGTDTAPGNAAPMTATSMDWEAEGMAGFSDDDSSVVESLVTMSWSSD